MFPETETKKKQNNRVAILAQAINHDEFVSYNFQASRPPCLKLVVS